MAAAVFYTLRHHLKRKGASLKRKSATLDRKIAFGLTSALNPQALATFIGVPAFLAALLKKAGNSMSLRQAST